MISQHHFQTVITECLVIVQQSIEIISWPVGETFFQAVRTTGLCRVCIQFHNECLEVLVVIYIRTGHCCLQSVYDLVIDCKRTGKVLVVFVHSLSGVQPGDRVTVICCTICSILIINRNHRAQNIQLADNLVRPTAAIIGVGVFIVVLYIWHIQANRQFLRDIHIQVRTAVELFTFRVRKNTGLSQITDRSHIFRILGTSADIYIVFMQYTGLVSGIIPVCVRMSVWVGAILKQADVFITIAVRLSVIIVDPVIQHRIFGRTDAVYYSSRAWDPDISVVSNTRSTGLTAFGRYQNNSVGGFRTVDGGRGGILQDRDTFDVVRVDTVHRTALDPVDQDVGRCVIQRSDTTDTDITSIFTGTAFTGCDRHTRHQSLQTGGYIRNRSACQFFACHRGYGSGQVGFLLGTVSYHHDFVQLLRIFSQSNFKSRLSCVLNFLCQIADERDLDHIPGFYIQYEVTIHVGDSTVRCSFYDNRGTGNRAEIVVNCSF